MDRRKGEKLGRDVPLFSPKSLGEERGTGRDGKERRKGG